jgi:hypothetical protein
MAKMNLSIERDGDKGGTYRRRIDDAFKAMNLLAIGQFRPEAAFVFYWLTCEKIAKVMVAIEGGKPGPGRDFSKIDIRSNNVIRACEHIGCAGIISKDDINAIFSDKAGSACRLRNKLFHDFGPTHVDHVQKAAPRLNGQMKKFLSCRDD